MEPLGDAVAVRRPRRWDEPFDPTITDGDVAWLRTRPPFCHMKAASFPPATPLEGIIRGDCRIRRCAAGELIVREGDYGNSAFLVLAGSVRVVLSHLQPEQLGRQAAPKISWRRAVAQLWQRGSWPETRDIAQVTPTAATRLGQVDDRQAIFLQDFNGVLAQHATLELSPGELFGEVAAMYRSPRTATVVADTEVALVEIRWQGLRLLRRDRNFADQLEQHYRAHWLLVHLRETPLLRFLPEANLQRVAAATVMHSFGRLEWNAGYRKTRELPPAEQIESEPLVAREGHLPTDLVLIRSGFARVCREHGAGHQTSAYLGKGQLFGLAEIAHNALRPVASPPLALQQSLRAVGFLDTLHIPVETVAEEILPHVRSDELPPVLRNPERPTAPAADGAAGLTTGELEFLVQHRLNNGRQAMVIDLNRCTRCDDCVRACATTHDGNPRFVRSGPTHQAMQFVQACMHCTDPVCMVGCPTGAIARDDQTGTVRVHEPICVGCGTCASACPYGTVRMVEVRDASGRFFRDEVTGLPILKATKCDLCQTQPGGPACVNACPHDALVRIDLSETRPLARWLQQRAAPSTRCDR